MNNLEGNIGDFLIVDRGSSGITEELIYNNQGNLPVISATSTDFEIFGKVNKEKFKNKIVKEIILIVRVGKAGKCQLITNECIVTENVLTLRTKDEFIDKISLKWFARYINDKLITNARGDLTGQRNISKEIIDRIPVSIPDMKIQQETNKMYGLVEEKISSLTNTIGSIDQLKELSVITKTKNEEFIKEIFKIEGGNSGLTEEFIYNNQPINKTDLLPVFSGSNDTAPSYFVSKQAKIKNKSLKIFESPAIIVARKGKAGHMKFVDYEKFTINDDAYVLKLKKKWENKISLWWFINNSQKLFYQIVTSKSDNATFNKEYAEKQEILIPDNNIQKDIGSKICKLNTKLLNLISQRNNLINILKTHIIH